ncbi:RmlC-like cupin domain containing protein [Hyaloscypha variabilis]
MAPLKTGITRALRSKIPTQLSLVRSEIQRGITATSKTANWPNASNSTTRSPSSAPFPLSEFQHHTPARVTTPLQPRTSPTNTNTFTQLLNSLTHSLTTTPSPHLPTLSALLRAYSSNATHWSQFAHANPEKQYTRNLVCEVPGIFNLLLLVWTPGKASPIHDHADAHCLMKVCLPFPPPPITNNQPPLQVLKGSLLERRFAIPSPSDEGKRKLTKTSHLEFGMNKVTYMADSLGLHEIGNPSQTEYAVSLHLYTPPNAAVRGCHVFEEGSGERRHVVQGRYDSVGGVVPVRME